MASVASEKTDQAITINSKKQEITAVETRKRLLDKEYPDTLSSIVYLVLTYSLEKRWNKSEKPNLEII